jgi:hypothetical protein
MNRQERELIKRMFRRFNAVLNNFGIQAYDDHARDRLVELGKELEKFEKALDAAAHFTDR